MTPKYHVGETVQIKGSFTVKNISYGDKDTKVTRVLAGNLPLYEVEIFKSCWFTESQLQPGPFRKMIDTLEEKINE